MTDPLSSICMTHFYDAMILEHLLSLTPEQRRLRFFGMVSDEYIRKMYLRSVENGDVWLANTVPCGFYRLVVGVLQIAPSKTSDTAEIAFSVLDGYSNRGIATELMSRAVSVLKVMGVNTLTVVCLSDNQAVKAICRKNSMQIVYGGMESESELEIQPDFGVTDITNLATTPMTLGGGMFSMIVSYIRQFIKKDKHGSKEFDNRG